MTKMTHRSGSRFSVAKNRSPVAWLALAGLCVGSVLSVATPASGAVTAAGLCVDGKLKALGRYAKKAAAKCYAKDAKKPGSAVVLTGCVNGEITSADHMFSAVTFKAFARGGRCPATVEDVEISGPTPWLPTFLEETILPPHNEYPNVCASSKIKAIGKYADKLSKCYGKNYKKPNASRFVKCQTKAEEVLADAFATADAKKGPCASATAAETMAVVRDVVERQFRFLLYGDSVLIDSPDNGIFTNAPSVLVTGSTNGAELPETLDVNGSSVLPLDVDLEYETTVPLLPSDIFNPIVAKLTTESGLIERERVTLIVGDGVSTGFVPDGSLSPESLAMRFTDTGLGQVKPIVTSLAGDSFDIGGLLLEQNPVLDDECVVDLGLFCGYFATVNIDSVDFTGFDLDIDALASGSTAVDVTISNFDVDVDLNVRDQVAVNFNCGLRIFASGADIDGTYDMVPKAGMPSKVDVNQVGPVGIVLNGFGYDFTSGVCDAPIIGDIIDAIVGPMIRGLVEDGFSENLQDPDGSGPADSPIAAGIETALDGIDIAGPIGQTIGAELLSEFSQIQEDADGITFRVDSAFVATPVPGAPDLAASYSLVETFPTFGATTPVGGVPYGIALGISSTAFNQLLKAQIETGLLQSEIGEFDLGFGPLPLTVGLLKAFIPELDGQFEDAEPIVIELRPALAPVVTGSAGPGGELAELRMSHLIANVRLVNADFVALQIAVDVDLGIDLVASPSGLTFGISEPAPEDVRIDILENPLNSDEAVLQSFLAVFLPVAFPDLAGALGDFPLPSFLGLALSPVEISRTGDFMTIYADLTAAP